MDTKLVEELPECVSAKTYIRPITRRRTSAAPAPMRMSTGRQFSYASGCSVEKRPRRRSDNPAGSSFFGATSGLVGRRLFTSLQTCERLQGATCAGV